MTACPIRVCHRLLPLGTFVAIRFARPESSKSRILCHDRRLGRVPRAAGTKVIVKVRTVVKNKERTKLFLRYLTVIPGSASG
jgi:hypothetical protein